MVRVRSEVSVVTGDGNAWCLLQSGFLAFQLRLAFPEATSFAEEEIWLLHGQVATRGREESCVFVQPASRSYDLV